MRAGQDPDMMSKKISWINNKCVAQLGSLDEAELVAVVLSKAPAEYQAVLAMEQWLKGETVTTDNLIAAMNLHYRGTKGASKNNMQLVPDETVTDKVLLLTLKAMKCFDQDGINKILAIAQNYMMFFDCRQVGHKEANCPRKICPWSKHQSGGSRGNNNHTSNDDKSDSGRQGGKQGPYFKRKM